LYHQVRILMGGRDTSKDPTDVASVFILRSSRTTVRSSSRPAEYHAQTFERTAVNDLLFGMAVLQPDSAPALDPRI
jgi:hypothetical protein